MTTVYKSKIIKFKLNEDPLQRRIYFLTFVESVEIIFSQYKETCEVLLDYPKIGGGNIKEFAIRAIRNNLHANIDLHSGRLIVELPVDGTKCIETLQSYCANMTFSEKVDMTGFFNKSHRKEGNLQLITLKYSKIHRLYHFL